MTSAPIDAERVAAAGMDPARLAQAINRLDAQYVQSGRLPFLSLSVSRRSHEVLAVNLDGQRRDGGEPVSSTSVFRIHSMTKPIVSAAVLACVEQGALSLDDPIEAYLPEWSGVRVWVDGDPDRFTTRPATEPITVKQLMTHTSGLTYSWMGRHPVDELLRRQESDAPARSLQELSERAAQLPLVFDPGTRWRYSIATDILGRLLEVIDGTSLDASLERRILVPLAMRDTGFFVRPSELPRLVACYALPHLTPWDIGGVDDPSGMAKVSPHADPSYGLRPNLLSGGGGLLSTVSDYRRFCEALLQKGSGPSGRILGKTATELMTRNHLPGNTDLAGMGQRVFSESSYLGIGFGLGVAVVVDAPATSLITSEGEYFWGGAAGTFFLVNPVEELVVVAMTQLMPSFAFPLRRELRALIYGALAA